MVAKLARAIPEFHPNGDHADGRQFITPASIRRIIGRQDHHAAAVHMIHTGQRAGCILGRVNVQINVVTVHAFDDLSPPLDIRHRRQVGA